MSIWVSHSSGQVRAAIKNTSLISNARATGTLTFPTRFMFVMELRGHPDRLIVCVHHSSLTEDVGMDLYDALMEHQVTWDDLESAAVEEYHLLGKPVEGPEVVCRSDGTFFSSKSSGLSQ